MIDVERIEITPPHAKELLELNIHNRPVNERHINALASAMKRGEWKFNGDTICLNDDQIIDGQHRLMACVRANVPFETLIVYGLPASVFDTKDTGKKRSAADALAMNGESNTKILSASLAFVEKYMTGNATSSKLFTIQEIEDLMIKYPGMRNAVRVSKQSRAKGLMPQSTLAGLYFICEAISHEMAAAFFSKLISGVNMVEGEPVYVLRERLVKNAGDKAKLPKLELAALTIKAWNLTRDGRTGLKSLRWRTKGSATEIFPTAK